MLAGVGGQHSRTRLHTLTSTTAFVVATLEAFHVMTHIHQHEAIKDIFSFASFKKIFRSQRFRSHP